MNFRLARPDRLIDLNGVDELAYLREEAGELVIGAMTRTAELEHSELVAERWGLLRQAVRFVGHFQIRSRGTVGGSVAHADPAAELPAAFVALGARLVAVSKAGSRTLDADGFFLGHFTTQLRSDEVLTEIRVPPASGRHAFEELARRRGDFALAGIACALADGSPRVVALGVTGRPLRLENAEARIAAGASPGDVRQAATEDLQDVAATTDLHAGGAYRKTLAAELAARAYARAAEGRA
jgi:CO/xanthine dehydrogenase FAD-binding subunit